MKKTRLLIVDDDQRIRATLSSYLRESGYDIITAANCAEARKFNGENINVALLDLMLPDGNGLDLLREFRAQYPNQVSIMISGAASLTDAVQAVKSGAVDFLEKPLGPEKVEIAIANAFRLGQLDRRIANERQSLEDRYQLVGDSAQMKAVKDQIEAVSQTDSTVLLLGESGTGKELAAHLIHLKSKRRLAPFIAVNTAAIPNELLESEMFGHERGSFTGATQRRVGKFEQADSGTLFLDEIGEMPAHLQAKLLRVLESFEIERVGGEKPIEIDFRLVCATNRNLGDEMRSGKFRQDLFFRINVFTIELPALRSIPGDIKQIAQHHLRSLCAKMGKPEVEFAPELLEWIKKYKFPGNVRELRNIIEHLLITHREGTISTTGLSRLVAMSEDVASLSLKDAVARFEGNYIERIVKESGGNITRAAEILGLDRSYLYRKMKSLGLDAAEE
ncbi:MAG: sigma-54 dependent transcriptional regulator [Candidatus Zixiibacteriota bacterium]